MTFLLILAVCLAFPRNVHAMKKTYTGNSTIDYLAERMLKSAGVKNSMSTDTKVKKIYHYMTVNFKHTHAGRRPSFKAYYNTRKLRKQIKAYGKQTKKLKKEGKIKINAEFTNREWNMIHRIGNCTDIAAMFAILCRHEGIKAGTCNGHYKNRNGTRPVHSWNYAIVDGKKYYYDVDVEIKNYRKGQGDYYWYKKTLSQARQTHAF